MMDRVDEIKRRVTVRDLAEEAGAQFRGDSSACVLHGGDNPTAFHLRENDTRWHCFTNCQQNDGDVIDFWQRWQNVTFAEAVRALGQRVGLAVSDGDDTRPARRASRPAMAPRVSATWQETGGAFCEYAHGVLMGDSARLEHLREARGLSADTVAVFGMGFNERGLHVPAERWGLTGDPVYLHPGVVIPHVFNDDLMGIKIRVYANGRPAAEKGDKYRGPRGGRTQGVVFGSVLFRGLPALVLCEGEFDAMLAWQEAAGFCDVGAVSGAKARANPATLALLARYASVLVVMDDDEAGDEARAYWGEMARVRIVPPPDSDLTDYWLAGGDLRVWIADQIAAALLPLIEGVQARNPDDPRISEWISVYDLALAAALGDSDNGDTRKDG